MSQPVVKNREWALAVVEATKRYSTREPLRFTDPNFPKQNEFILDDSERVSVLCTRRAGKSFGIALKLYRAAFAEPESTCLYIGLTRKTAKKIMWKDCFKSINRRMKLGCKFNESELSITCPNGSVIYLEGGDSSKDEMDKVLGGKLKLVVIDEAGSFRINMEKFCYEMIEPALTDYDGTLAVAGTPTDLLDSLFHKITTGREAGWSGHEWDTLDNPYMKEKWQKKLDFLLKTKPGIEETPSYRRMYKKEWVTDISSLCYKFNPKRNLIAELPPGKYVYVLGVDLGWDDDSAFVICAFQPHDKTLYIIESYKKQFMTTSHVAERIKYYESKYDIYRVVIDNATKQAVEDLKERYGLALKPAEKHGKAEFIDIMSDELILGKIKVIGNVDDDIENDEINEIPTSALRKEWKGLIWDDRSEKREEHPACDNHCSDGALYAWRECYQYLGTPEEKDPTEAEKLSQWEEDEAEKVEAASAMPWDNEGYGWKKAS